MVIKTSLGKGEDKAMKEICCVAATFPISKENAHYTKWNLVITNAIYKYSYFYFLGRDCSASSILITQVVTEKYILKIYSATYIFYIEHLEFTMTKRTKKWQQPKTFSVYGAQSSKATTTCMLVVQGNLTVRLLWEVEEPSQQMIRAAAPTQSVSLHDHYADS